MLTSSRPGRYAAHVYDQRSDIFDRSGREIILWHRSITLSVTCTWVGTLASCRVALSGSKRIGPRAASAWPPGQADTAELCEGLPQTQQERCERCGSYLRGGDATFDAVRADQDEGAADRAGCPTPSAGRWPDYHRCPC